MAAYLYVIGAFQPAAHKPEAVKVGIATNVASRCFELQCGNHLKLEVMRTYALPSKRAAHYAEAESHKYLARHRLGGEWFRPDDMEHVYRATQDAVALARGVLDQIKIDIPDDDQVDHDVVSIVEAMKRI